METDSSGARVHALYQVERWDEAAQVLAAAAATLGTDLAFRCLGEDIAMAKAEERTEIARQLAEFRPSAASAQLVHELLDEQRRIELGVAYARYERYPSEPVYLKGLAECLEEVGNYSEALKYLEQLQLLEGREIFALVAKAKNWQRLRQFDRALACYRHAISRPDFEPSSIDLSEFEVGLYQGSNLATAMGEFATALAWLEQLVAHNPAYKDAAERLVNLRAICHKGGFPAGQPSHGD